MVFQEEISIWIDGLGKEDCPPISWQSEWNQRKEEFFLPETAERKHGSSPALCLGFMSSILLVLMPSDWNWSNPTGFLDSPSYRKKIMGSFSLHHCVRQSLIINLVIGSFSLATLILSISNSWISNKTYQWYILTGMLHSLKHTYFQILEEIII